MAHAYSSRFQKYKPDACPCILSYIVLQTRIDLDQHAKWWDARSPFYTVLSNVRFGVVRYQSILPYSSGLLHWHKDGSVDFCGTRANSLHYIVPTRIPRAWPLTSAETPLTWVPFNLFGITWIPEWVSNYLRNKVWDETIHPFSNFNGSKFGKWSDNFIPRFTGQRITYPCWDVNTTGPWSETIRRKQQASPNDSKTWYRLCKFDLLFWGFFPR